MPSQVMNSRVCTDPQGARVSTTGEPRFTLKPLDRLCLMGRAILPQELQGDFAAEPDVFRLVDHAHSAAPQLRFDAVMRDRTTYKGRGRTGCIAR